MASEERAADLSQPPGDVPLVFVEDLDAPELDVDDRHHLERALRVRPGADLVVCDGAGRWRLCVMGAEVVPQAPPVQVSRPDPRIGVGFALVKGSKPELIVQKLTELGVDRIRPFVADRSVVRWGPDRASRNHSRLARIAREAAMQSRRCFLPVVEAVASFAELAREPGVAGANRTGDPPDLASPTVLVGPEGGWSADELGQLGRVVALGPQVMRSETAAMAAGALLAALRSKVVAPVGAAGDG